MSRGRCEQNELDCGLTFKQLLRRHAMQRSGILKRTNSHAAIRDAGRPVGRADLGWPVRSSVSRVLMPGPSTASTRQPVPDQSCANANVGPFFDEGASSSRSVLRLVRRLPDHAR